MGGNARTARRIRMGCTALGGCGDTQLCQKSTWFIPPASRAHGLRGHGKLGPLSNGRACLCGSMGRRTNNDSCHEGRKMSSDTENRHDGIALPITEMSVLKDLEQLLQDHGDLEEGEAISVVLKGKIGIHESNIGAYAENHAVVALSVRYCALTALPESLGQLTHLQQLDVTGNQLTALPESLGNLLHLKKLFLDENQLAALPESLGNLLHLEEMHADRNQLTTLPATLSQLTNLETLRVYGNQLASLPANIDQLTRLKDVSVGRNQLISLPESLWQLIHLQSLNVAVNQLYALSESIDYLTARHTLDPG